MAGSGCWSSNGDELAKVGQRREERTADVTVRKKHCTEIVFYSHLHRANSHGFNVAITLIRWQPGRDAAVVQSCFEKIGHKHMTYTADLQRSSTSPENKQINFLHSGNEKHGSLATKCSIKWH